MRDSKRDYIAVARLRAAIREFESAAEDEARAAGLTPQRYLLLLMVKGAPDGEERATINDLAERLRVEPHSITGATRRAEQAGLIVRDPCTEDRRRMWIRLTAEGERRLERVVTGLDRQREALLATLERLRQDALAVAGPADDAGE